MADEIPSPRPLSVALVIDELTFERLAGVIGHLTVGLLDYVSQITLVTPAEAAKDLSLGPVRVLKHKRLRWPLWELGFRKIVDEFRAVNPNVVHTFSRRALRLGDELALEAGLPLVGHVLSADDLRPAELNALTRMKTLIAASEPLLRLAQSQRLDEARNVTLVRPGLLTAEGPTCFVRDDWTPTLLCMSAFEKTTGVERLVRAVKILTDEGHDLMLFLLGQGPIETRLRHFVERERLIKHVSFGKPVANWNQAMRGADIFVVPGAVERVDVRLLHALGAGMAAVTCAVPNSDFMIHEQTGLICEETPEAMADAIRMLLEDRLLARRLANAALEHCKKYHSLSFMAEKTAQIYREVLQPQSQPA